MKKAMAVSLAVFVGIFAIGFMGGVDYTERGFDQGFTMAVALICAPIAGMVSTLFPDLGE